jgi:signal transduction histidine kinase
MIETPPLGLHQAWLFAQRSGGAVSVESVPRAGTKYRIWLPETDFKEAEAGSS